MHKILILGKIPPPYFGPAIATDILINSSLKRYYQIVHFNSRINDSAFDIGKVKISKLFKLMRQYYLFQKVVKKERPVLALIPISQSRLGFIKDTFYIRVSRRYGVKTILHLRGSSLRQVVDNSHFFKRKILKTIKSCDGVIVLGHCLRSVFKGLVNEDKLFVVPNGADFTFPKKSNNNSKVNLLFLSNLQSSKGVEDVLNSLGFLPDTLKSLVVLNVVGAWRDNELMKKCQKFAESGKLPVVFHNPLNGTLKWQIYADSDIFIFPPRNPEGHPWVVIEAMAAGLPIISTDQGAITESVINGVNGFIVKPHSPEEISEKLRYLIDNPRDRILMGKESRMLYQEKFTEDKMVENLRKVFENVLNQP